MSNPQDLRNELLRICMSASTDGGSNIAADTHERNPYIFERCAMLPTYHMKKRPNAQTSYGEIPDEFGVTDWLFHQTLRDFVLGVFQYFDRLTPWRTFGKYQY